MRRNSLPGVLALALLAGGCGGGEPPPRRTETARPAPAAAPAAPPKEMTGREAFQSMFIAARSWAADARPFRLTNFYLKESTGAGGKAAAWTTGFASASLRKYRTLTYSTVKTPNLHEGVYAAHDETYRSESELTGVPFLEAALKVDTDKAFAAAEAKGGKAFREKNPGVPITYLLEYSRPFQRVVWRVCYDSQCSTSPFTVDVDAATGAVVKVSK